MSHLLSIFCTFVIEQINDDDDDDDDDDIGIFGELMLGIQWAIPIGYGTCDELGQCSLHPHEKLVLRPRSNGKVIFSLARRLTYGI